MTDWVARAAAARAAGHKLYHVQADGEAHLLELGGVDAAVLDRAATNQIVDLFWRGAHARLTLTDITHYPAKRQLTALAKLPDAKPPRHKYGR